MVRLRSLSALIAVAVVAALQPASAASEGAAMPSGEVVATADSAYPGRLLLTDADGEEPYALLTVQAGSKRPTWEDTPRAVWRVSPDGEYWLSEEGYLGPEESVVVSEEPRAANEVRTREDCLGDGWEDVRDGNGNKFYSEGQCLAWVSQFVEHPDPGSDLLQISYQTGISSAQFSPDSQHLAYSRTSEGTVGTYDLALEPNQDRPDVLASSPCASYSPGGLPTDVERVCGAAWVFWIDPETLLVHHRTGPPPTAVNPGTPFQADTYSIITINGAVIASGPGLVKVTEVRGSTALLEDGRWLDLDVLRSGAVSILDPPEGDLLPCLSPDGSSVVVTGDPWEVVDLRTDASTRLGTRKTMSADGASCVWSPNGEHLAVQTSAGTSIIVVPVSEQAATIAARKGALGGARLLAWTE